VRRPLHTLGAMGWGLVSQDTVPTLSLGWAKLMQPAGEAVGLEAGPLPPEGVAGGGFDRRLQPGRLVQRCNDLEGLHAQACHAATGREMEAQAAFVVAENPHRLVRPLTSSGGDGTQAARPLLDPGRRRVFVAWLGLGRFSWALRW
jgi:hypothetical protein